MKKHIVIIGTIYPLLLYLLHRAELKEKVHTVFFLSDQLEQFAERLPNSIVIHSFHEYKNPVLRKISEFCWIIALRIKCATVWRKHFRNAEIFAQDHFIFSSMLIGKRDYKYISDGFNDFHAYMRSEIYQDTFQWRSKRSLKHTLIKLVCGPCWKGWFCLNDQCCGVLHENPQKIPYAERAMELIKVDMKKIWNILSEQQKEEFCYIFGINSYELNQFSQYSILVLAQNYECTDDLSEDEMVSIYRNAISGFDESQVIIKTHQFGTIDYKRHFLRALVFEKKIPMQFLVLLGMNNIKTVITINSTAVSLFGSEVEIIWLSEKVHPVLFARYGENTMEEIVSRPAG